MFIDIEEFKSALEVENILAPYKCGAQKITPDVCLDILQATNFKRNIRDMLGCVAKLPAEEQAMFQDVVLNTFDSREQPNDVWVLGKKLAVAGGYEEALNKAAQVKDGSYLKSFPGIKRMLVSYKVNWSGENLSNYQGLKLLGDAAFFNWSLSLPEELDLSECQKASFFNCDLASVKKIRLKDGAEVEFASTSHFPEDLDVSMCNKVRLREYNLAGQDIFKFKDGAKAAFIGISHFPEEPDFSMCDSVELQRCDFKGVHSIKLKEGADFYVSYAYNLPEGLDVSGCRKVNLSDCDLSPVKHLQFKEGAEAVLLRAQNLPADLDVSVCSEVCLRGCDLRTIKKLKFKDGARVDLSEARNLPAELDVSGCSEASLDGCDLGRVKIVRFRDKTQRAKSHVSIPFWSAQVVFADEEKNMAMLAAAKSGRDSI